MGKVWVTTKKARQLTDNTSTVINWVTALNRHMTARYSWSCTKVTTKESTMWQRTVHIVLVTGRYCQVINDNALTGTLRHSVAEHIEGAVITKLFQTTEKSGLEEPCKVGFLSIWSFPITALSCNMNYAPSKQFDTVLETAVSTVNSGVLCSSSWLKCNNVLNILCPPFLLWYEENCRVIWPYSGSKADIKSIHWNCHSEIDSD